MSEQTVITMRRADGKLQDLHGPHAERVAARRAEQDGWEYVNPLAADPAPEAELPAPSPPDEWVPLTTTVEATPTGAVVIPAAVTSRPRRVPREESTPTEDTP